MFTGIITELGEVLDKKARGKSTIFQIGCKTALKDKQIGQSIAVNGVCTTITEISKQGFEFEAIEETMRITNLKNLETGDEVNLEAPLTLAQGIDGHLVQGHIDTTGQVSELTEKKNKVTLNIKFPPQIARFLAFKGSITVNGVSLTIAKLEDDTFTVELTDHTLKNTNFKNLKKGDIVNLETDLIARHLERLLDAKENETKYHFLKDRNLI